MSSRVISCDVFGNTIDVQCKITKGLPSMQIVGLGNKAVDESKERVRAAFHSSKIEFPKSRIVINLSPADIPKDGAAFDLSIALSIMIASGICPQPKNDIYVYGELGLDGSVLAVRGIIGRLQSSHILNGSACIVPEGNAKHAMLVPGRRIVPVKDLYEALSILSGTQKPRLIEPMPAKKSDTDHSFDEVKGQELAKRALTIAGAGYHNVLLYGPPGTGKSMLAKALSSILPDLSPEASLTATHLHSLRKDSFDTMITRPPLRSPHHSASNISILGGGQHARPGEVTLAHHGILFLDEMLEFSRSCIEALRQPLEDRVIHVSRAELSVTYPASFLLIATMNPCPCGYLGSKKPCTCSAHAITLYQRKLSGPIADRIDIFVKVDDVELTSLLDTPNTHSAEGIRSAINAARQTQNTRQNDLLNAHLGNKDIRSLSIDKESKNLLDNAAVKLGLSPRSYFRTLRVAQTIADLDHSPIISPSHIAESLQYRPNLPSY